MADSDVILWPVHKKTTTTLLARISVKGKDGADHLIQLGGYYNFSDYEGDCLVMRIILYEGRKYVLCCLVRYSRVCVRDSYAWKRMHVVCITCMSCIM